MKCFECGAPATEEHHVIPRSHGGTKTVPLCGACHARVHDMNTGRRDQHALLTRAALQRKIANGERAGAIPYGFSCVGGRLVENADEQRVIRRALEMRGQGLSYREVADALTSEGYKPRGRGWYETTIWRFLRRAA